MTTAADPTLPEADTCYRIVPRDDEVRGIELRVLHGREHRAGADLPRREAQTACRDLLGRVAGEFWSAGAGRQLAPARRRVAEASARLAGLEEDRASADSHWRLAAEAGDDPAAALAEADRSRLDSAIGRAAARLDAARKDLAVLEEQMPVLLRRQLLAAARDAAEDAARREERAVAEMEAVVPIWIDWSTARAERGRAEGLAGALAADSHPGSHDPAARAVRQLLAPPAADTTAPAATA